MNVKMKSEHSVGLVPLQSLEIQLFKLLTMIVIILYMIGNEPLIDESVANSNEIAFKVVSCLFVDTEHEWIHLCVINVHHHI